MLFANTPQVHASETVDRLLDVDALPGIVWATVDGDHLKSGASGFSSVESGLPMTETTLVQVGSVTKTLVALGVLRLISTDQLSLDTNVEQLLPELNWQNPWHERSPITVRHLLEHSAGLDNLRMWQFLNSSTVPTDPLLDAFPVEQVQLLKTRTEPGLQYSYSNMGYTLLGLVIERVARVRYEDYLREALLLPLGMQSSTFEFMTQSDNPSLATGYVDVGVTQTSVPMVLRPSGQFTTTARDMQRLLEFMLGAGLSEQGPLIRPDLMSQLARPTNTDAAQAGLRIGHGLALAVRDRHGVVGHCHPGTTFGFRANLCLFPESAKAFFYAINADFEQADYERFTKYFIQQLHVASRESDRVVNGVGLQMFTGRFALSPSNMMQFEWLDWMFNTISVEVSSEGDALVVRSLQQPTQRLLPVGERHFRRDDRTIASHVFYGEQNEILSNGLTTWKRTSMVGLILAWSSLICGMLGLLYIVLRGVWVLVTRQGNTHAPILLPWVGLIGFAVPAWLYSKQSFLQFGEVTAASVALAVLTGLLPVLFIGALVGLTKTRRRRLSDLVAVVASLQLCGMLLAHGVIPVMFWS